MGLDDFALLIDEVGDPAREHILRRVARVVQDSDGSLRVADQPEREILLLGKPAVLFRSVEAGPEDLGVAGLVVFVEGPEPGPFLRSTGCGGLRVEPEHDFLSSILRKRDRLAVMVDGLEIRSLRSCLQHGK